jgi:amine acid ABC transporter, permease protein, 3-TM region, His/Glu/Gln/Arg/opine family
MVEVLAKAYGWTLLITFCALFIGVVLGTLLALCKVIPRYSLFARALNRFADGYILLVRGTPVLVQLLIIGSVIFANTIIINRHLNGYVIAIIGFGLNSAAYVAEIIRTGILSVDKGQMEAGRSLGLTYSESMSKIVLPQACKNIIPPLGNEAIMLVKENVGCVRHRR